MLVAVVGTFRHGHASGHALAPIPLLASAATATVYLSVPDTEASVLLGAALVPITAAAILARWRGPWIAVAGWAVVLGAATVAVTRRARPGPWAWGGWWVPKIGLAVVALVAVGWILVDWVIRRDQPDRPAPPPP